MKKIVKSIAIFSNLKSGGAKEVYLYNLKYLQSQKNLSVKTYHPKDYKPNNLLEYLFIILFKLPKEHKNIASIINKTYKLAIIHHSWLTQSPYILRYLKIPSIYICHEVPREYYDQLLIKKFSFKEKIVNFFRLPVYFIDKLNIKKSKNITIISNSKQSKTIIDKVYSCNSQYIYPIVNLSQYLSASKNRKYSTFKKELSFITVGSIHKHKNQDFLIKTVSKVKIKYRPSLIIIGNNGDSSYIRYLVKLAKKLKVNLTIKIKISKKQLIQEYLRADCFIYSPISEPFGLVVLEAMGTGLPIITTSKAGGFLEILDKKNVMISPSNNPNLFAKNIESMIINKNKRIAMSKYNIQFTRKYFTNNRSNASIYKLIMSTH